MVSIIVAVRNQAEYIEACVLSLINLDYPQKEIIVVDDASTDGTFELVRKLNVKLTGLKVQGGPAKARNVGALISEGEILAFVDGDCIVPSDWLKKIVKLYGQSVGAAGGPNYTPKDQVSFGRWVGYLPGVSGSLREDYCGGRVVHIRGCNSSYLAKAFWEVGGFDEAYTGGGGEEEDLTFRILNTGYRVVYSENAYLWHWRRKTLLDFLKQHYNYGRWGVFLRLRNGHIYSYAWRLLRSLSIYSIVIGLLLDNPLLISLPLPVLVSIIIKTLKESRKGVKLFGLSSRWISLLFFLDLSRNCAYYTGFLVGHISVIPLLRQKRKIIRDEARIH
ncbi:MAG: glycosyltransferase [Candidatus Hydrothermarchaeales archaeon]